MAISFYNTLTKRKEEFIPRAEGKVSMYTCGPTVYDYFHIGNARSFVASDVIRRYFEYRGFEVNFIMNLTDIDDRIIQRAIELGTDSHAVAQKFIDAFFEDIEKLRIHRATHNPKATDHVREIVDHIQGLLENGAAYTVDGDVYFRVEKFPQYGRLSGKKLDDLIAGARVETDMRKENPADFALWKAAKPGEPTWDAPWGTGRPGWHIECSAMSRKFLGDSFDIHAGGNDLIFPHHENEIAQSEALTHEPFARYWMHFGFLNIDDEKMSKSLGNFFTTREILQKYDATVLRFFYMQTHYRAPLNFTQEGLEASEKGLQKIANMLSMLDRMTPGNVAFDCTSYRKRFEEAMNDDLNSPMAIGVIFELIREVHSIVSAGATLTAESLASLQQFFLQTCNGVFGIVKEQTNVQQDALFDDVMSVLLAVRSKARAEKQWAFSDFIRDELARIGITVQDSKQGSSWKIEERTNS